jgi:hypothetical protein
MKENKTMIINCEPNWDRIILKDMPKKNELFSIKVPIKFINFKCGQLLFTEFKKYLQDCSNIEIVINESEDIIKEKESRIVELKEEIQRCCDNKLEISTELLKEYNNLI